MGKLRGEKDIEATIQRLDRLTLDEGLATAAQTLEVVYGLVWRRRAIMDGEKLCLSRFPSLPDELLCTYLDSDGNESAAGISSALGMFQVGSRQQADRISDWMIESIQGIVSKMNKAERALFPIPNVHMDRQEY